MEETWKTKDGKEIPIENMTTQHIKNTIALLERKGFVSPETLRFYTSGPTPFGECAQLAYEEEQDIVFEAPVSKQLSALEDELNRRKEHKE